MLARLSASSTACLARRTTPSVQRLASQARFNSSEAAAQPAPDTEAAPKKRAIPIADSLGNISISSKSQQDGQRRSGNGDRRQSGVGNWRRDPDGQQRPRQNPNRELNGDGFLNRTNAAGRKQNNNNNNGQRNGQRNGPRPPRQQDQKQAATQGQDAGQPQQQQQQQRDRRGPRQPRSRNPDGQDEEPLNIPASRKIELGNLDDIFGTPARAHHAVKPATDAKQLTPSEDRVQSLLERSAGDYSRYVPKPLSTTDVRELSPLELGSFVLSKRRDVKPQARQSALAIVGKFPGTTAVAKEAPAQAS